MTTRNELISRCSISKEKCVDIVQLRGNVLEVANYVCLIFLVYNSVDDCVFVVVRDLLSSVIRSSSSLYRHVFRSVSFSHSRVLAPLGIGTAVVVFKGGLCGFCILTMEPL